jgi:hypothetical protein
VCGDKPIAVGSATAAVTANTGPPLFKPTKVTISWSSSLDQDNGEKDVARYMIFKKDAASLDWGSPIADLAAAQTNYTLDDTSLSSGTWVWGVVAQDCSPDNSDVTSTGVINVP